jgi:hypothetical protein
MTKTQPRFAPVRASLRDRGAKEKPRQTGSMTGPSEDDMADIGKSANRLKLWRSKAASTDGQKVGVNHHPFG